MNDSLSEDQKWDAQELRAALQLVRKLRDDLPLPSADLRTLNSGNGVVNPVDENLEKQLLGTKHQAIELESAIREKLDSLGVEY